MRNQRHISKWALIAFMLAVLLSSGCMTPASHDPEELHRTWMQARVFIPGGGIKGAKLFSSRMNRMGQADSIAGIPPGQKLPTVIYLHGCTGLSSEGVLSSRILARAGYAVIAPDSFARRYSPLNCNTYSKTGTFARRKIKMRQAEAGYAIREARKLPFVDPDNVFLMGLSEGGFATATFSGEPVNARIIEGATCHAEGWYEWEGINAPEDEPVLALLAANDPWRAGHLDCGRFMEKSNGSHSHVFKQPHLRDLYALFGRNPEVQELVLNFLYANKR